ncbi:MAG: hypothetical protein ACRDIB_04320 [Ardenticatenaceae bacterium]
MGRKCLAGSAGSGASHAAGGGEWQDAVRDVTFHEDASHVRAGHLPHVLATLRNIALTALRRFGLTAIRSALVRNSARPFVTLAFLVQ